MDPCTAPGLTVVTDDTANDAADGAPNHDIVSASVSYPFTNAADPDKLYFTIKVASLTALTPSSFYFVSFTIDNAVPAAGTVHGVRMAVDAQGGTSFSSYIAGASGGTPPAFDGRFVASSIPAESGSNYNVDGTITIIVKRTDVGVGVGHTLTNWDGAVAQTAGGAVTAILDWMPTGTATGTPTRGGTPFLVQSNQSCNLNPTPTPSPSPTASPSGAGRPRLFNYEAPLGMAESAGEPSIGVNFKTEKTFANSVFTTPNGGTSMYFGGFMTAALKVTFSDCSSPATVTWDQKALTTPNAPRVFGDPILFTDPTLGRTFVCQLLGLTPAGSTVDVTDNDGDSFLPSEGSSLPSDIDHETIGGGPAHAPLDTAFNALPYKHPVYYSAQSISEARAARSDDGGFTFGPGTLMYTAADCSGLHGHTKVAPDGTVYIPNNGCGGADVLNHSDGQQAVIVSEDNGVSWSIRKVPGSTTKGDDDAAVGVSVNLDPVTQKEVIYLGMQSADGHPRIAVSKNKGVTWSAPYDVGAVVVNGNPVVNCVFPEVVAGDYNRAAFAFFGTETAGAYDSQVLPVFGISTSPPPSTADKRGRRRTSLRAIRSSGAEFAGAVSAVTCSTFSI